VRHRSKQNHQHAMQQPPAGPKVVPSNQDEPQLYSHPYNQKDKIEKQTALLETPTKDPATFAPAAGEQDTTEIVPHSNSLCYLDQITPFGQVAVDATDKEEIDGTYWIGKHPDMNKNQRQQLIDLLRKNRRNFACSVSELTAYTGPEGAVHIPLKPGFTKCFQKPRRVNEFDMQAVQDTFPKLEELGFIRRNHTSNDFASSIVVVSKKSALTNLHDDRRVCIDYSRINLGCETDTFRFDSAISLQERVCGSKYFSLVDQLGIPLTASR